MNALLGPQNDYLKLWWAGKLCGPPAGPPLLSAPKQKIITCDRYYISDDVRTGTKVSGTRVSRFSYVRLSGCMQFCPNTMHRIPALATFISDIGDWWLVSWSIIYGRGLIVWTKKLGRLNVGTKICMKWFYSSNGQ